MQRNDPMTIPAEVSRSQANKKTKFIVGGAVIVVAIIYLVYTGIQSTSAYFYEINELQAQSETLIGRNVRVTGMVDAETIDFNVKKHADGKQDFLLTFEVMNESGDRLPVVFNGPKPDQMREGAEAILEGEYDGSEFTAQTLLLKCPSRYEDGEIEQVQVEAVNN